MRIALVLVSLLLAARIGAEETETLRRQGDVALRAHRYAVAEARYRELLRQSNAEWGQQGIVLPQPGLRELIEVWRSDHKLAQHEVEWQRELAEVEARSGANSEALIRPLQALGLAANARGDYRAAIGLLDRITAILDHADPRRHEGEMRALTGLDEGISYQQFLVFLRLAAGDEEGARKQVALRDVATHTIANGTAGDYEYPPLDVLYGELVYAWTLLLDGNAKLAARRLGPLAAKCERLLGNDHFNTASVFDALADALERAGRSGAAGRARAQAKAVRRRAEKQQAKTGEQ